MKKKIFMTLLAIACVSFTTAFAKAGTLTHGRVMFGDYGSAKGYDETCTVSGGGNQCASVFTVYTLGNTQGRGSAYINDQKGKVVRSASAMYIEYPAKVVYTSTNITFLTYHSHSFVDGRQY